MLFRDLDLTPYLSWTMVLVSRSLSDHSEVIDLYIKRVGMSDRMSVDFREKAQFSDVEKSLPG